MIEPDDITFSVNDYDRDGDVFSTGIFLHFGDTRIMVAKSLGGLIAVAERISSMAEEIQENYNVPLVDDEIY